MTQVSYCSLRVINSALTQAVAWIMCEKCNSLCKSRASGTSPVAQRISKEVMMMLL